LLGIGELEELPQGLCDSARASALAAIDRRYYSNALIVVDLSMGRDGTNSARKPLSDVDCAVMLPQRLAPAPETHIGLVLQFGVAIDALGFDLLPRAADSTPSSGTAFATGHRDRPRSRR
jgi:hypothetical protein